MTSDLVEPVWATTLIMQPWQCQGHCLVGRAVCVGSGVLSTWTLPPSACVKSGSASNCSEEQYIHLWWESNTAHTMELLVRIRCNNTCKMPGTWWEVCWRMFHLIPLIFSQLSRLVTNHFYQRGLLSGTHCFLSWGGEIKSSSRSPNLKEWGADFLLCYHKALHVIYQESTSEKNPQVFPTLAHTVFLKLGNC